LVVDVFESFEAGDLAELTDVFPELTDLRTLGMAAFDEGHKVAHYSNAYTGSLSIAAE